MEDQKGRINRLTTVLVGELFKAFGFNSKGLITKTLSTFVYKPIKNFAEICIGFDQRVVRSGFQAAAQWIMPNFAHDMHVDVLEKIPTTGPLIICSNHPGAYDSLVIASNLPRDDIKIVVNIPLDFINEVPATLSHFLYAPNDPFVRMSVVRSAIKHLKSGGALLVFASGRIDPDPTTMIGAEDEISRWSRSLELMLRSVPETKLLITIVSNILHVKYVNHAFTKFQKERPDKQRISEFMQVIHQIRTKGAMEHIPRMTISKPFNLDELCNSELDFNIMNGIKDKGRKLLAYHLQGKLVEINL